MDIKDIIQALQLLVEAIKLFKWLKAQIKPKSTKQLEDKKPPKEHNQTKLPR